MNETGSAGPAEGTPAAATPRRPPSWTTARRPGVTTSRTRRAVGGGDHAGARTGGGSNGSPIPATARRTRSPGASSAYGGVSGEKSVTPVRPTSCHPPGDAVG